MISSNASITKVNEIENAQVLNHLNVNVIHYCIKWNVTRFIEGLEFESDTSIYHLLWGYTKQDYTFWESKCSGMWYPTVLLRLSPTAQLGLTWVGSRPYMFKLVQYFLWCIGAVQWGLFRVLLYRSLACMVGMTEVHGFQSHWVNILLLMIFIFLWFCRIYIIYIIYLHLGNIGIFCYWFFIFSHDSEESTQSAEYISI